MTVYRKCRTCTKNGGDCPTKEALRQALKGLHVTSVLHNCPDYEPPFKPGDPILMKMSHWEGEGELADEFECEYPGHFIRHVGPKAFVYVKPGTPDLVGGTPFEARANGFCKVAFYRLSPNPDGSPIEICPTCVEPVGVRETCAYFRCPQSGDVVTHL